MGSPKRFEKSEGTENDVHPAMTYPIQTRVQGGKLSSVLFHSLDARCIQTGILRTRWNMSLLKPKAHLCHQRAENISPGMRSPRVVPFPQAAERAAPQSQCREPTQDWLSYSLAAAQQPEHASKRSSPAESVAKAVQRNWWIAVLWGKGDWGRSLPPTHLLPVISVLWDRKTVEGAYFLYYFVVVVLF